MSLIFKKTVLVCLIITATNIECHGEELSAEAIKQAATQFKQFEYYDPAAGNLLKYNLFIPQDADSGDPLPMVVFIHDSLAADSESQSTVLSQAGAVVWVTPERQAKNSCYVLAPQYSVELVGRDYNISDYLDYTYDLIDQLTRDHNIDPDRIYIVAQGAGAKAAWAMNTKHPDLFAASLLLEGGWNPEAVATLKNQIIWVVASQNDEETVAQCEATVVGLENVGAKVMRNTIDTSEDESAIEAAIESVADNTASLKYTLLKGSTTEPDHVAGGSESVRKQPLHIAYSIKGFTHWLFSQSK